MEDYLKRMLVEQKELKEKVAKLEMFIDSYKFRSLTQDNQKLLKKQLSYMLGYLNTLTERIVLNGGLK